MLWSSKVTHQRAVYVVPMIVELFTYSVMWLFSFFFGGGGGGVRGAFLQQAHSFPRTKIACSKLKPSLAYKGILLKYRCIVTITL